jgi:hypothetical protein
MISEVNIGDIEQHRHAIKGMITARKQNDPSFTVIDVGGSMGGWSADCVDAIMDFNKPIVPTSVHVFPANLNKQDDWQGVLEYVAKNGKFSYAICSHTLEDIANPTLTMDMLPRIASAGYIAVPSKYRELAKFEGNYRGYIHHRWIYDMQDGRFTGFPKLSFIEYETDLHALADRSPARGELSFCWKDSFDYQIINNDYMGPDVTSVKMYYKRLLE